MERSVLTTITPFNKGRLLNVRDNKLRNGRYFAMLLLLMVTAALRVKAQAPIINTVNPMGGPIGTVVTITGSNLASPNSVTIGGQAAQVLSNTGTSMQAVVEPNASSGPVSVANAVGTANTKENFTVTGTPYPSIQQGGIFLASNTVGNTNQGWSEALSADGNTAVIGAINDNATSSQSGAVFVLTRVGGVWTQQAKLFGNDAVGYAQQGTSVAITPDGNTILVGGYADNQEVGACWIYKRSGNTWTQQGSKIVLTGPTYVNGFGQSVSLSADGNTFVAGAANSEGVVNTNQTGISGVFHYENGAWVQKAILQNPGETQQGWAVAISADASTIAVGSNSAVDVYTYSNNRWVQPGTVMPATGATVFGFQGDALAFSADGNTLAAGNIQDGNYIGAVWIFTRTNGVWSQQGSKISGNDASGQARQGSSVSLSADGNTMAEGGLGDNGYTGAAWVFTQNNGVWTQQGPKLVGTGASTLPEQGSSVALSANGTTLAVGGQHNGGGFPCLGGTWFFATNVQTPTTQATNVSFANTQGYSTNVSWTTGDGATRAVFVSPGASGTAAPATNTSYNANSLFGSGDQIGSSGWYCVYNGTGSSVNLTGLTPSTTYNVMVVEYNGTPGLEQYLTSTAAGNPATVTTGPAGPVISSFSPAIGPVGTLVTITGTGLSSLTSFKIGGQPAITISNDGSTLVGMVMPNATTGCISLANAYGTANGGSNFTVAAASPQLLQQGNKLTETGGAFAQLGASAAFSADGNTAIIGAPLDNSNGDAVVFIRSGSVWSQSAVLIGSGSSGGFMGGAGEGHSVALSADGKTAIIGGNQDNNNQGAVWVFTQSGGVWTQQGSKLVGTDSGAGGNDGQGTSVSISADGNTLVEGGQGANSGAGAAWVFTRSAGVWSQATELTGTGSGTGQANQGSSVAISADASTILVAGKADNNDRGAVWVFTGSGSTWTQQGTKLTPSDANTSGGGPYFGTSTALSADGNTAIIGGPADASLKGASWIFTRSGGVWGQQGSKLFGTGSVGQAQQGWSVAISADGNTAIEGGLEDNNAIGASWVFTRSGSAWNQQGNKLIGTSASGNGSQGTSVAISADGSTGMQGASVDNGGVGAAWAFAGSSAPATQASNITFSNTTQTTTTISWTPGTGTSEAVFIQAGSSGTIAPSNNTTYTANTAFSSGTQIGSTGWYCVFNGAGSSVNVTGLTLNTNYHVMVFDYNGTPGGEQYLTATGANNPADLTTLPLPAVYSISAASGNPTNKTSIDYTVTFASPVTNLDVSNFSLTTTGAVSGASIVSVTGSGSTFDVNINAGTGEGTIQLSMVNANGVLPGISTQLPFAGDIYTIDRTPPSGSINYFNDYTSNSTTAQVGDQLGIGFDAGDATTVTVTFDGNPADNVSQFFGWNASYTTRSTDAPGPIALVVTLTDAAGNSTQLTANGITLVNPSYVSAPTTVVSISPVTTSPTNATTLDYTVTFASALTTPPSTDDFTLTGTATGTINSITTTDNIHYDVNVTNVSGNGGLELDMTSGSDAVPIISNMPFPGGAYTIDNTAPTASNITFTSNNANPAIAGTGNIMTLAFTASEAIQAPTVSIEGTSISATNTGGNNWTATYTIQSTDSKGRIPFSLQFNDLAGNASTTYTDQTQSIDEERKSSDATLFSLTVSNGTLSPSFSSSTTAYSASVGYGLTTMTVTPTVNDPGATVTVNGTTVPSGTASGHLSLVVGANTVPVVVTAADGTQETYTLTVNEAHSSNNNLSALTLGGVTFSPSFTAANTSYSATVANTVSSVNVTATEADPTASIKINTGTATSGTAYATPLSVGANTISIAVTAQNNAVKTYTVTVTRLPDVTLSNLTVSNGALSPSTFAPATTAYSDNVGNGLTTMTISPVTNDPLATFTIAVNGTPVTSGPPSGYLPLVVGANTVTIVVTGQDHVTTKTYTLTVNEARSSNNNLSGLAVANATVTPVFASGVTSYTGNVNTLVTSTTVTPAVADATATVTQTANGAPVTVGSSIVLNAGTNTIVTTVTAQNGAVKTYTVTINRLSDANLSSLALSNGTLNTTFTPLTTSYSTNVGNGLTTMTITPTAEDPNATITVNTTPVPTGTATGYLPLVVGANTETITVTSADNSNTQTYTLIINEARSANNNLSSLTTSTGTLSFAVNTLTYSITVPSAVTDITLTPTLADPTASISETANGATVTAGSDVPLSMGANTIVITVTAQNTTTKTYTVTVTRQPDVNLSNIAVSNGTLTHAFSPTQLTYTDNVGNGLTTMTITPTAEDPTANITVNGIGVPSGTATAYLQLVVGANTETIVVTSADGTTSKTYTLTINEARCSNDNLSKLTISSGTLSPSFKAATTSYTVSVDNTVSSVTVTPTVANTTSTIVVNTGTVTSGSPSAAIPLSVGANTISIIVTAQTGASKTYTIIVTQAPPPSENIVYQPISVEKLADSPTLNDDGINVHQGVSPNGDGINDYLQIDNITNYPDNNLKIMNRNGLLVYEAKGYDNATKAFDGHSNKTGQMQLPGTYFYELDYTANGVTKHKTGYLVLKY